jgi:hypothetical protein
VRDLAGNPMVGTQTTTFVGPGTIVPIADIHAHLQQYRGQQVTVQGQVYIPTNYRVTAFSGYVQDASARGINLFGSFTNNPLLQDIGNIVQVTGTVDTFFTTVEIVNLTSVQLVSSGNPPLQARHLSTGGAASRAWEGTYIEVTGPILAIARSGPATNYTVNDGSGPIVVRVVDTLGVPQFSHGELITARGAGGQFQADFQILVGRAADIFTDVVRIAPTSWSTVKKLYRHGTSR